MTTNTNSDVSVQSYEGFTARAGAPRDQPAGLLNRRLRLLGGALLLGVSATLVAQTHFCIGGDLDHMQPADIASCQAKMSSVRNAVKQSGGPADWHFVVVCDDAGWKDYTSFSRSEAGMVTGVSYSTDPRLHWTFLRGSDLDAEQPEATATVVSLALSSIPVRRGSPQLRAPAPSVRQYGIASAEQGRFPAGRP